MKLFCKQSGLALVFFFLVFAEISAQENQTADKLAVVRDVHITVDDAVNYATEHSYAIRQASVDLSTKGDAANHVLNAIFPTIQVGTALARANSHAGAQSEADYWTAMGTLSLGLNYNGSLITDVRKAQEDYKAGQITFEQTLRQTKRDIKKLFYSMLLSQKSLENDRLSLESARVRYEQAERSFRNGYITRQDYLQSGVSYQNMRRDIEREEQVFNQQIDQFALLLGLPAGSTVVLEGDLTAEIKEFDEYKLMEEYGPSNSQYVLSEISLNSIEHQITGLSLKTFTPTFSLNYSLKPTLSDFDSNWFTPSNWTDTGSLSFSVSWDLSGLFPWSNNRIQSRNLEREKEKLQIQKEQITSQLWAEMKKVTDEINYVRTSIETSKNLIAQAEQAYNLTSESYRNGLSDFLTVRDAETQLNKAKLAYQSDLYTYISNMIELEYLLNLPENWANN